MSDNYFLFILFFTKIILICSNSGIIYSHRAGEYIDILAESISSKRAIIPYGYTKLNIFNSKKFRKAEDTLGGIILGESYYTTGYFAKINEDKICHILRYNNFSEKSVILYKNLIERRYFTNWVVDKLPPGLIIFDKETKKTSIKYSYGVPLGFSVDNKYYVYNHLQFHILLNKINKEKFNIVGFNILPISIKHEQNKSICQKQSEELLKNFNLPFQPLEEGNILFTYDVIFEDSNITFASRWDHYKVSKSSIHWTGIIISSILVCLITGYIIYLLRKNINSDINSYNYKLPLLEEIEVFYWKQIEGDVLRPPEVNTILLSSLLGTGSQLLMMLSIILFLGAFGFMNLEGRGTILNAGITFYCLCGLFGGYISSNFYKFCGGENWIKATFYTSALFPGILLLGYSIINIVLTIEKSNAAVKFIDFTSFFILWIFFIFPTILIGNRLGYKNKTNRITAPVHTNKIPSRIPEKPWYLHYKYITFITGLFGFMTIFIEFNYVMRALLEHEIYFLVKFLCISFFLFIIVVGEMTILVVYSNLRHGDYNWWWKSFIVGSSPVIYFVLYSIYYFFYLRITTLSAMIIYFCLMVMISIMVIFICGTISVFFSLGFLKILNRIYSKVKNDAISIKN